MIIMMVLFLYLSVLIIINKYKMMKLLLRTGVAVRGFPLNNTAVQ